MDTNHNRKKYSDEYILDTFVNGDVQANFYIKGSISRRWCNGAKGGARSSVPFKERNMGLEATLQKNEEERTIKKKREKKGEKKKEICPKTLINILRRILLIQ